MSRQIESNDLKQRLQDLATTFRKGDISKFLKKTRYSRSWVYQQLQGKIFKPELIEELIDFADLQKQQRDTQEKEYLNRIEQILKD